MAEFQRDGGGLESGRGPQYRKSLLPWEHQFCETLGITEEEYFEYYELVAQCRKEELGRELIPDIRNEPVTVSIALTVVGIAIQVAASLLAPKPRAAQEQKDPRNFQGSDVRGRTKFSPLTEFSSVQDLATLGSVVPLVYTKWTEDHGGVRVESQMMWSRLVNRGTYQELRALLLFSAGRLPSSPAYEGFAFGDSKIESYPKAKLGLFFSQGRSKEAGNKPFAVGDDDTQYSEGKKDIGKPGKKPFFTDIPGDSERYKMIFCGVVTPSQSANFGQYSPFRNGQGWKYAFKYPGKGDGDADQKPQIYGTRCKYVTGYHAGQTTLKRRNNSDKELVYRINSNESDTIFCAEERDDSTPELPTRVHFGANNKLSIKDRFGSGSGVIEDIGGLTEGINAINQGKIDADTALDVGELYLIGAQVYRCTKRNNIGSRVPEGTPFEPEKTGSVEYFLDREPEYYRSGYDLQNSFFLNNQGSDIFNETHMPIQKVALGSIGTTRAVNSVIIGFKSTVYRQVNGYPNIQEFTGPDQVNGYAKEGGSFQLGTTTSYYGRVALFRMEIKLGTDDKWINWNGDNLFAVYGNNPQPSYNEIQVIPNKKTFMQFRFVPVCGNTWIANNNYKKKKVMLLNAQLGFRNVATRKGVQVRIKGRYETIQDLFRMNSRLWEYGDDEYSDPNANPNSLLADFWYYDADTASHANEPEHQITHINEFVENKQRWYDKEKEQYEHLAYAGLICQSNKDINTFSNFSAYFERGIRVEELVGNGRGATNKFPEIAYDLLTNRRYGVGEFIGNNAVNKDRFVEAAKFCAANNLHWDGIISRETNLREFMFAQAGYQLLDFEIRGGEFSLYPSVPFKSDYSIDHNAKAGDKNFKIEALFTDGNVRNFKTTMLSPEERQLFIAELKYREETRYGFPETRVTRVRLKDSEGGYYRDPVEVFDMTQFCTLRGHAIKFAKFALRLRQTVDHSISFETTPDAANALAPGDYIRVGVSVQHQERQNGYNERLRTGSVTPNGTLQYNEGVGDGTFPVYYWKPSFKEVRKGNMEVKDGKAEDVKFWGSLFTRDRGRSEVRVYKIESIAFSEESFVEISATYVPLNSDGTMKLLDWDNSDFVIEDNF